MTITTKATTLSIKATEDATRTFTGYASTFNGIDSYGDSIAPGAFADTIARHAAEGTRVPILYGHSHDLDDNIGEVLEMSEDDHGLLVRAQLDDTDNGKKVYNLIKSRRLSGLSIGFYPTSIGAGNVDGKSVNVIETANLVEISVVLTPADANARVTAVKNAAGYEPGAISSGTLSALVQAAHSGASVDLDRALNHQKAVLQSQRAAVEYRENLLAKGGDPWIARHVPTADERAAIEKSAITEIMTKANNEGRGLTATEFDRIDQIRTMPKRMAEAEQRWKASARIEAAFKNYANNDTPEKDYAMSTPTRLPITRSERGNLATRATAIVQEKNLNPGTSTTFTVPMMDTDITDLERPARSILELLPAPIVTGGPAFSYMRQSRRELNAAVVPAGELKPESHLGFTRVDETLDVVAHIAKQIDEYLIEDVPALNTFIAEEMAAGVYEKVDALAVQTLYKAEGHILQEYTADPFSTARRAIAELQALGLTAGAIVLNPITWADMETAKAEGSGEFVFKGAPVNQDQQTLWGVPVVTSLGVPEGNGLVLDLSSAEVRHDNRFKFSFFVVGEDVERNQLTVRAEGRFKPIVKRERGVVEMLMTSTATPNTPETAPEVP